MYDEAIVRDLAACGLNCARCVRYSDGSIKKLSTELLATLEGYDRVAERISKFDETLKNYPAFKEMLQWFSSGEIEITTTLSSMRNGRQQIIE